MIVNDNFGSVWIMTAVNETDYRLTMKTSEALRVRTDTLTQTISTIEKKINGYGLAESSVQPRGGIEQILVTLPGLDDPARIKQLLQTAAVLELYEVQGGPFASREEAMQSKNGVLPLSSQIVSSRCPRRFTSRGLHSGAHAGGQRTGFARRQACAERPVRRMGNQLRTEPGRRRALREIHRRPY